MTPCKLCYFVLQNKWTHKCWFQFVGLIKENSAVESNIIVGLPTDWLITDLTRCSVWMQRYQAGVINQNNTQCVRRTIAYVVSSASTVVQQHNNTAHVFVLIAWQWFELNDPKMTREWQRHENKCTWRCLWQCKPD